MTEKWEAEKCWRLQLFFCLRFSVYTVVTIATHKCRHGYGLADQDRTGVPSYEPRVYFDSSTLLMLIV